MRFYQQQRSQPYDLHRSVANKPVRFDRVVEPWGSPSMINAAFDCFFTDLLAIGVKERQLSTRLAKATAQPIELCLCRFHLLFPRHGIPELIE